MQTPQMMDAMVLEAPEQPLQARRLPVPKPSVGQVLVRVHACGVCHTDLHVVNGELPNPKLPLILGHQIVGTVAQRGDQVEGINVGDRIGVPWLGHTCGQCDYCGRGQENLCEYARFTGYTLDGGFAEYTVADQRYCFPIPESYGDVEAAPLLCAGLIGYRSYRMCGPEAAKIGIYGFGAAAHIVAQIAVHQGKRIHAFTRPGDTEAQVFARRLGAVWAGDSTEPPPEELDAAIIFASVGSLVPAALKAVARGGVVVCGGIHMSDIPSFPYRLLWEERVIRSVANLTRQDGIELLKIAPKVPVKTTVQVFPLQEANEALNRLRSGRIEGAAVLRVRGLRDS